MNDRIRVLVISSETWRSDVGGGNVLTNFFEPLKDKMEFAHIYCGNDLPENNSCNKYYQISEIELLHNLFVFKPTGKELKGVTISEKPVNTKQTINYQRKHYPIEYLARNVIWKIARWKTNGLKKFILDFQPDVIYAPLYGQNYMYMLDLEEYAYSLTGKQIFSYISDDLLSLKQISYSPIFWLTRLYYRYRVKMFASKVRIMYTMTDEQKKETEEYLNIPVKILRKSADFTEEPKNKLINNPIKLVFAGNMFYGRYKTLYALANEIKRYNNQYGKGFELHIYSRSTFDSSIMNVLNDCENAYMHGLVSPEALNDIYRESDIALHVEDFDKASQYMTRLSFSTKIIDLLHSGCAVMAIGPSEIASMSYLKKEDAAICVTDISELLIILCDVHQDSVLIDSYRIKAWSCGKRNHSVENNNELFIRDFTNY